MIKKLLIANRGEIVVRIIKACAGLGIKTVVVYSDADSDAAYLAQADEAYNIGPANPMKSYLNIEKIIEVLNKSGVDAVHPGYGFLAENFQFGQAVVNNGSIWVGPPPGVMRAIESKSFCREVAARVGVPVVPGSDSNIRSAGDIRRFVAKHGFPVLLKLDKGGGGKGIEVLTNEAQIETVYERISRIGKMAFDSADCYIEKKIERPRHIEVQFLADTFGNCICLGERECSIQRRHQKIIEEAPSPVINAGERKCFFDYTVKLVNALGYQGAGTIEFLRSPDGMLYFMEINGRLQVEHPVTEFVTSVDIVKSQLKIASGEKIEFKQNDIKLNGHAIEARIYGEDPETFTPSPGTITALSLPETNDTYLRIDHALQQGGSVPAYYDPLLAKVIAWGPTRAAAITRLKKALTGFQLEGVSTTIPVNLEIINDETFVNGSFDTAFLERFLRKNSR